MEEWKMVKTKKKDILEEQLKEVIPPIQGQITVREFDELDLNETEDSILADPSVKNFSFAKVGKQVYYRENSRMNCMDFTCRDNRTCLRHDRNSGYYQEVD